MWDDPGGGVCNWYTILEFLVSRFYSPFIKAYEGNWSRLLKLFKFPFSLISMFDALKDSLLISYLGISMDDFFEWKSFYKFS
jgi:hypothetical protein